MLNQFIIIGSLLEVRRLDDFFYEVKIDIPRNYKEINGGFKSDNLSIRVWKGIADSLESECYENFLVSITGRIESIEDGLCLIGEKLDYIGRSNKFIRR